MIILHDGSAARDMERAGVLDMNDDNTETEPRTKCHDINLSPHTSRCRCARNAPHTANQVIHTQSTNDTAKDTRMIAFQRHETGLEEVKMIARHRS